MKQMTEQQLRTMLLAAYRLGAESALADFPKNDDLIPSVIYPNCEELNAIQLLIDSI